MDDVQYEEMQDLEFGDEHEPEQGPRAQAVQTAQAQHRTQQEAAKAGAVTRVPRMKRKLTAAVLKGMLWRERELQNMAQGKHPERGHYLELVQDAAELFWKKHRGHGHEVHDVRLLMKLYRSWHKCIYPEEKSFRTFARRIANNSDLKRGLVRATLAPSKDSVFAGARKPPHGKGVMFKQQSSADDKKIT